MVLHTWRHRTAIYPLWLACARETLESAGRGQQDVGRMGDHWRSATYGGARVRPSPGSIEKPLCMTEAQSNMYAPPE